MCPMRALKNVEGKYERFGVWGWGLFEQNVAVSKRFELFKWYVGATNLQWLIVSFSCVRSFL